VNELIESLRTSLDTWGELVEVVLNAISLICIVAGVILSLVKSVNERRRSGGLHPEHTYFRRMFGGWLIVALEFQLAADIVGTIVSPTSQQLIELGAIAVIRTFLNYFLGKELREEREEKEAVPTKIERKKELGSS
jgi:uncharacterized membrane protein